ncbi:response regulator transcription factor [Luteipulveratus flavus]|uniref:Response regulator transcription factor n=1 Tax=Luteipulveratus flavus TaxID=3031728 RepID=A0ABT6C1G9_9MICO|nr:response regulator transcription factor [Luteipulveratus sp. YIM 133296]MDF8262681.1 response regulator transcription factor [Luteipulveratus sp. YIM 133296]
MSSVLVVEDDPTVAEVVQAYLTRAGHRTTWLEDGGRAQTYLRGPASDDLDLVLLDLLLPGVSGLDLCTLVRRERPELAVIMLTALSEEDDRIAGLERGADDYVTKPFSPRELTLRVDSVLRRAVGGAPAPAGPEVLTCGPLTVDVSARRAVLRDERSVERELGLTVRETDVLIHLMRHPGRAFTREQLMEQVWGWTVGDQSTVTVHVRRIRQKIEDDPSDPRLITTVWGVGYRMDGGA